MKATAFEITTPLPSVRKFSNTELEPGGLPGARVLSSEVEPWRPASPRSGAVSGKSVSSAATGISS